MSKFDLTKASEEMASFVIPGKVKVVIGWIGEGLDGDYDSSDPEDVPLLRFDAYDLAKHGNPQDCTGFGGCCRSAQDASYCTRLSINVPKDALESVCRAIAEEIADAPHWKRILESWSWVDEKEALKLHEGGGDPE